MPLEERFEPSPAETETIYPEAPVAPTTGAVDDPPGPPPFEDEIAEVREQVIEPEQTGDMPDVSLDPGDDIGPSSGRGELPGETNPGQ